MIDEPSHGSMKGHEGLAPGARDRVYLQVHIQPRHAPYASQFLTM